MFHICIRGCESMNLSFLMNERFGFVFSFFFSIVVCCFCCIQMNIDHFPLLPFHTNRITDQKTAIVVSFLSFVVHFLPKNQFKCGTITGTFCFEPILIRINPNGNLSKTIIRSACIFIEFFSKSSKRIFELVQSYHICLGEIFVSICVKIVCIGAWIHTSQRQIGVEKNGVKRLNVE